MALKSKSDFQFVRSEPKRKGSRFYSDLYRLFMFSVKVSQFVQNGGD